MVSIVFTNLVNGPRRFWVNMVIWPVLTCGLLAGTIWTASASFNNQPPSVDAGLGKTIILPGSAALHGIVSDDGLPGPPGSVLILWSKASGPGTVTFADFNAVDTTASFSQVGSYILRLTASDGELTASDEIRITVDPVPATTIQVPQDQPTIQTGIDAAQDGALVLVSPGVYTEQLALSGKTITLASQFYTTGNDSFIGQTVIDGQGATVINVDQSVGQQTKIIGFTIQNGNDGISPSAKLHILNNRLIGHRDAIDYEGGGGVCSGNVFENNSDDAIDLDGPVEVVVEDNIIRNSGDDGIEIRLHTYNGPTLDIVIRDNTISTSDEDGIQLIDYPDISDRFFLIEGNVIENSSMVGLGLMDNGVSNEDFRAASIPERIHLFNNSFVDNSYSVTGGDNLIALNNLFVNSANIALKEVDGGSIAAHNMFWNNGTDNQGSNVDIGSSLLADPLLDSQHRLQIGSPAIDAGIAQYALLSGEVVLNLPNTAYYGTAPDLGAFESTYISLTNQVPSVDAGLNQVVNLPNNTSLDGTVSDDGLPGGVLTTTWSQISGQAVVTFGDASAVDTTASISTVGVYGLQLTADDGALSASDQVTVTVNSAASSAVFVGAGDISDCGNDYDEATATTLDVISGTVFTLGDNVYPDGTDQQFSDCYDPTWGRHKVRTRPVPGNHDYHTPGASGYYNYFGPVAGDPDKGYYSYDLGDWHIIALNTECGEVGGCTSDSPQGQWLQADLAANPSECILAYSHKPRFSSGQHGGSSSMEDFWQILYDAGADVVLSGHDHNYERFAPQDPFGAADPENGMRQFVVGTGGKGLRPFSTTEPNSEVRNSDTFGVLKLTLHPTGYDWAFLPIAGQTFTDIGSESCVISSPTNQPPVVEAGLDQTITLPGNALLDGAVSDDGLPNPPGAVSTNWSQVSGQGVATFGDTSAVDTTASFSTDGVYVLQLTVDDGALSASDQVTITVNPPSGTGNLPPNVDAGLDQTITLPRDASLDGTVSDDGLPGGVVTTTWNQVSGQGVVTFGDTSAVDTTASFSADGAYVLQLTADDGALSASDQVTITVNAASTEPITVEVRVMASSDDAEETDSGHMRLTSSDLELVFDGSDQTVGMRFNGLAIPQGATILNAYVQFQVDQAGSEVTSLTVEGEAADNTLTFTSTNNNISLRSRTVGALNWVPEPWNIVGEAGLAQQTPNIAPIIQEIVNRPGWSSGNSLVIIVTGTGERTAESYDGNPSAAPLLHVEYYYGPANVPPVANDDSTSTAKGTLVSINVALNDSDPDGNLDPTSTNTLCEICTIPANGTQTDNGNGTFHYIPNPHFSGNDNFVYEICDSLGACDTATVSIAVNNWSQYVYLPALLKD